MKVRRYYVTFGPEQSPTGSTGYREVTVRATDFEAGDYSRARDLVFEAVADKFSAVYASLSDLHPEDRVLIGESINMTIGRMPELLRAD